MKIKDVVCAIGRSGYVHRDMMAVKAGAKPDGFLFRGEPVLPGYRKIVEPGTIISVMLVLEDGQIAFGDCADVIFAGVAGRDRVFQAEEHIDLLRTQVADRLRGRDVATFKPNATELDDLVLDGRRLHTALRYGITQALLHATALAQHATMTEVVAQEYGSRIATRPIPILASCHKDDGHQLDRMILKRAELLPHVAFTVLKDHVGLQGEKLAAYAERVADRIREVGDADYRPQIHLDVYGTLGELFGDRLDAMADYLSGLVESVKPYRLLIESPIIAKTQQAQIDSYIALRRILKEKGVEIGLIVDEWCNTLEDIDLFAEAGAADYVQVKAPDLGGINNTIDALLRCKAKNMGACLGGTGNETDQSTRICTQIALACEPDFMLSKPGLGGDEALMIQSNEMARTLAVLQTH